MNIEQFPVMNILKKFHSIIIVVQNLYGQKIHTKHHKSLTSHYCVLPKYYNILD